MPQANESQSQLLALLRSSDEKESQYAAEALVQKYIKLVLATARQHGHLRDEFESIALEVLWDSVLKAKAGNLKHDNFLKYLMNRLRSAFSEARNKASGIPIPGRTKRAHNISGMTQKVIEMETVEERTQGAPELLEEILSVMADPIECEVIRLLVQGHTTKEIGQILKLLVKDVRSIRSDIKRRWTEHVNSSIECPIRNRKRYRTVEG